MKKSRFILRIILPLLLIMCSSGLAEAYLVTEMIGSNTDESASWQSGEFKITNLPFDTVVLQIITTSKDYFENVQFVTADTVGFSATPSGALYPSSGNYTTITLNGPPITGSNPNDNVGWKLYFEGTTGLSGRNCIGPPTGQCTFGDSTYSTTPLQYSESVYKGGTGGTFLAEFVWVWNGSGWSQGAAAPVPIPPAVWLLGSGLIGLVVVRRRMKR